MSCLGIGGIGCLVILIALFVVGGVVVAKFGPQMRQWVADFEKDPQRTMVMALFKLNPNLELVSEDQAKREVTFKVKGQAETYTMDLNEIKDGNGKLNIKNSKGEIIEVDLNDLGKASSMPAPTSVTPESSPTTPPQN